MAWDQHSSMTVTQLLWTVNQKKLDNDNFDWHSDTATDIKISICTYTLQFYYLIVCCKILILCQIHVQYIFYHDIRYFFFSISIHLTIFAGALWCQTERSSRRPGSMCGRSPAAWEYWGRVLASSCTRAALCICPWLVVTVSLVGCHHNWYDLFRAWCRALDGASCSLTSHIISGLRTRARNEGLQQFYNHREGSD